MSQITPHRPRKLFRMSPVVSYRPHKLHPDCQYAFSSEVTKYVKQPIKDDPIGCVLQHIFLNQDDHVTKTIASRPHVQAGDLYPERSITQVIPAQRRTSSMIVYTGQQIDNRSQYRKLTSGFDDFVSKIEDSSAMQEIPKPPGLGTQVVKGWRHGGSLATVLRKVYKNDLKFAEKLIASIQQLPVREQRFLEAPGDFTLQSTSPIDDSVTETDEVSDAEASGSVYHGTPHTDGQSRHPCNDLEETPTSLQPADSGKDTSSAGPKRPRNTDDLHSRKRQKQSGKGEERAGNSKERAAGNSKERAGNSEERAGNSEGEGDGNEATSETSGKHKTPAEDLPWPCPYYWKFSRGERQTVSSACYPRGNRPRYIWREHLQSIHTTQEKSAIGYAITSHEMRIHDEIVSATAQETVNEKPHPLGKASAAELLPSPASSSRAMFEKAITISTQKVLRDFLPYLFDTAHAGKIPASTGTSARAEEDLPPEPKMSEDKFTVSGEMTKVVLMLKRLADGPGQELSHDVRIVHSPSVRMMSMAVENLDLLTTASIPLPGQVTAVAPTTDAAFQHLGTHLIPSQSFLMDVPNEHIEQANYGEVSQSTLPQPDTIAPELLHRSSGTLESTGGSMNIVDFGGGLFDFSLGGGPS
ncbi:predicted protein [Verticillium alfalfae VaMs.102]|uniref:Predicted protein n=1 Tax=Verticillium alfalfae (strain VaMs.102 / ATCC MYA-4576 / FGSC 10136) TaxID=526221 RepID=C9SIX1_VERA1|nr:predicted protein [Verticillium alfalfae VaMs.102]EEY18894.1 predicted protein [Verticillium alfalfae VaMs.102]